MRTLGLRVLLLSAALGVTGCGEARRPTVLETRIADLEKQVRSLEQRGSELQAQLNRLNPAPILTLSLVEYEVVRMDLGYLTVRLVSVEASGNGSRITLSVGNPTSATIVGAGATLDLGPLFPGGTPDIAHQQTRDVLFHEPLEPGAWNTIQFVLDGVPPSQVGFVRVRNVTNQLIRLAR
jgi:hypothetical protein